MSENLQICPECQAASPIGSMFCGNCGAPLVQPTAMQEETDKPTPLPERPKEIQTGLATFVVIAAVACGMMAIVGVLIALSLRGAAEAPQPTDLPPIPLIEQSPSTDSYAAKAGPGERPEPIEGLARTTSRPSASGESPSIAIQRTTEYVDILGVLHIVGEVLNRSGENLWFVKIVGSLYDNEDNLLDTDYTYTFLDVVEPGDTASFDLIFLVPPSEAVRYELQGEYDITSDEPIRVNILSQRASVSELGMYDIVGEIENPHDFELKSILIVATCNDATGDVVRADFTLADLDVVGPGQKSPFELIIVDPPEDLDACELRTQASNQ